MSTASNDDFFEQHARAPIPTPRGVFVPPWYIPHGDTTLRVRSRDGEAMPFTIGDVAPERRWAIEEDGRVMDEREFADRHEAWRNGQWTWLNPPKQPLPTDFDAIPSVMTFVAKRVDPARPDRLAELPMPIRSRKAIPLALAREPLVEVKNLGTGWAQAPAVDPAPEAEPEPEPQAAAPGMLRCDACDQEFKGRRGLLAHNRQKHPVEGGE